MHHGESQSAGQLIVLTGPSGVGKGTLLQLLLQRHPQLVLSISATTRSPREGEVDGQDYIFLSREQFESLRSGQQLLEWAEFAGNYYGTPRQPVEANIGAGRSVVLEIELVGARQVRQLFPEAFTIFILPPSIEELERRLRRRGTESSLAIEKRLERARAEILAADEFDLQVINDDLGQAIAAIETALFPQVAANHDVTNPQAGASAANR
ncbi:MAG: guanylate kinase [Cyanobacteria bacterium P01_A01_bin.135]